MRNAWALIAAGLVGLAPFVLAPAAAFHGAAYTARGTATVIGTEETLDATLRWSGAFGFLGGQYTVELFEPATGTSVHKLSFPGQEKLENDHFFNECEEWVDYVGNARFTPVGGPDTSGLPNPVFHLDGWQKHNHCTGIPVMHFQGAYLTAFAVSFDV